LNAVGRLLRMLRLMSRLSVEEAAVVTATAPDRLRELETGHELSFQEGPRIAGAYLLCTRCFKRLVEAAVDRDTALAVGIEPDTEVPPEPPADELVEGAA
jgi:hypothetical protein